LVGGKALSQELVDRQYMENGIRYNRQDIEDLLKESHMFGKALLASDINAREFWGR
jgi:hypothetical protein